MWVNPFCHQGLLMESEAAPPLVWSWDFWPRNPPAASRSFTPPPSWGHGHPSGRRGARCEGRGRSRCFSFQAALPPRAQPRIQQLSHREESSRGLPWVSHRPPWGKLRGGAPAPHLLCGRQAQSWCGSRSPHRCWWGGSAGGQAPRSQNQQPGAGQPCGPRSPLPGVHSALGPHSP